MKKTIAVALTLAASGNACAVSALNPPYGSTVSPGRAYAGHFFGDDQASEFYGSNTFV